LSEDYLYHYILNLKVNKTK